MLNIRSKIWKRFPKAMWQIKYIIFALAKVRPKSTKLGNMMTYHDKLPPLKVTWPSDHKTNMRSPDNKKTLYFVVTKLSRAVTSGRMFRMQIPKSSLLVAAKLGRMVTSERRFRMQIPMSTSRFQLINKFLQRIIRLRLCATKY